MIATRQRPSRRAVQPRCRSRRRRRESALVPTSSSYCGRGVGDEPPAARAPSAPAQQPPRPKNPRSRARASTDRAAPKTEATSRAFALPVSSSSARVGTRADELDLCERGVGDSPHAARVPSAIATDRLKADPAVPHPAPRISRRYHVDDRLSVDAAGTDATRERAAASTAARLRRDHDLPDHALAFTTYSVYHRAHSHLASCRGQTAHVLEAPPFRKRGTERGQVSLVDLAVRIAIASTRPYIITVLRYTSQTAKQSASRGIRESSVRRLDPFQQRKTRRTKRGISEC